MEYHNDILCIAYNELVKSSNNPIGVMSESMCKKLVYVDKTTKKINRGCNGTPALIEFDTLPTKYKAMILEIHPDPRVEAATAPFIKRIKLDSQAQDYYTTYEYDDGKALPLNVVDKYTSEASILNTLNEIITDMTLRRKHSPSGTKGVWEYAMNCIDSIREHYDIKLPNNVMVLKRKCKKYAEEGYPSLIHAGFGNNNRDKIKSETGEAILLTLLRDGAQHDCDSVASAYNFWARSVGESELSARTVRDFLAKNDERIKYQREGKSSYNNKYDQIIRRSRSSAPLMLINSDDNDLDLYFKKATKVKYADGKIRIHKTEYHRLKLYVVTDSHCDYILGYAFGDEITVELIKEAYRNAMNHVRELTGNYHLWGQIVADRWNISPNAAKKTDLQLFFENQAPFTPPAAGLARSKTIERVFGKEWHKVLKTYKNYAGYNITAATKHNSDSVAANKKNFPTIDKAPAIVAEMIESMRSIEWKKSGKSRKEIWLTNFHSLNVTDERSITEQTYLTKFGHPNARKNKLTNEGLKITVDGVERLYDIPTEIYRQVVGKTVQVMYDTADMSRVLATDDAGVRFIARQNNAMPMAIGDMREGDRQRLDATLERKKMRKIDIMDEAAYHASLIASQGIDAHGLLQAGVLNKEMRFAAIQAVSQPKTNDIYQLMK